MILHAFHIAAEPVSFELRQNLVQTGASKLHLIERLHRSKASGATLIGLSATAGPARVIGSVLVRHCAISRPIAQLAASTQPSPARRAPHRHLCPAPPGAPAARPAPHCPR